jgi:site-specific DNA-methyltransferase (adenine-specific)
VLRDLTERVIIASKGRFDRAVPDPDRDQPTTDTTGQALLWADDFMDMTTDLWEIPSESATRVGHPAPFPVELPQRLIELFTYRDELVLDPFMGAGTTAVAALKVGRHYVGYDTDPAYIELADKRITKQRDRTETQRGPVILPAAPSPADDDENPMARAVREGRKAQDIAHALLDQSGFTHIQKEVKLREGVIVNFSALDADGREWWFDVSGAFTSARPGLQRTDTLFKALGRAAVLHHSSPELHRYVLLTTDLPRKGSNGARALDAVSGPGLPVYDVIQLALGDG